MSLPRMSLHIGDYRKDTGHLRAAGHGAYLLLIMHYWATGGLPDDDEQLAAIACMSDDEWRKWRPIIFKLFKPGWKHTRVEAELREAQEKYERRAAAGKEGGLARSRAKQCLSNAIPIPKQPITDNQERGGGGRDARATPLISDVAKKLADEIAQAAGFTTPLDWPPGWCGAPMRVQAMLDHGWQPEIMLAATREAMARKRDGPPDTIAYFEKPFARAHARQAAPLPVVEVSTEPEKVIVHAADQFRPGQAQRAQPASHHTLAAAYARRAASTREQVG